MGFPSSSDSKSSSACNAGDWGLIPGLGRSPGKGNDNPLQYSCLENPTDGSLAGHVHGVLKSQTRLKQPSTTTALLFSILPLIVFVLNSVYRLILSSIPCVSWAVLVVEDAGVLYRLLPK